MKAMSLEEFQELVAAYGANPGRWPAARRAAAEALLASSEAARACARREAELDVQLAACELPALDSTLERRLNEIPIRTARPARLRLRALWAPALACAAAAVCGVWLGSVYPEEEANDDQSASSSTFTEERVLALATGDLESWEDAP